MSEKSTVSNCKSCKKAEEDACWRRHSVYLGKDKKEKFVKSKILPTYHLHEHLKVVIAMTFSGGSTCL